MTLQASMPQPITLVLLPGMDGTGLLFRDFVAAAPAGFELIVIDHPADAAAGYAELLQAVLPRLPQGRDYFVLAESFSGPLGLMLAASPSPHLLGLILCCTFARNPSPAAAWFAPLLKMPAFPALPRLMARVGHRLLFGRFATADTYRALRQALSMVAPPALLARMRAVLQVNVRALLPGIAVPLLYLRAEEDRVVPQAAMHDLVQALPQLQVTRFAAPHMLLQTTPAAVWTVVQGFVADHA